MKISYINKIFDSHCSYEILNNWSIVHIFGIDSKKYLNSQITMNLYNLKKNNHIVCGHCNSNGKIYSFLRLFFYNNGYLYLQNKSICKKQIEELKKYAIFSNLTIKILKNYICFGVIGIHVRKFLLLYFSRLPNKKNKILVLNKIIILWFQDPIERFLILCKEDDYFKIQLFFIKQKIKLIKNRWLFTDIRLGIPILQYNTINKFFPKELNLDILNALDIHKGCYRGQEIISKMHFRNINNKKLYFLIGIAYFPIKILSVIESYDGNSWKKVGKVFFILRIKNNVFMIQAILNKKNISKNIFRIINNKSLFHL